MTNPKHFTHIDFIYDLIEGRYERDSHLKLAARLASFLPNGNEKTELQDLIIEKLRIEEAVLVALEERE